MANYHELAKGKLYLPIYRDADVFTGHHLPAKFCAMEECSYLTLTYASIIRAQMEYLLSTYPPSSFDRGPSSHSSASVIPIHWDEELKVCIEESQKMEQHYGHFFEFIIIPRISEIAIGEVKQG
ncbi:hypothetical protein EmuJ_000494100 [Echinococcus multilocularis]|uniref:Uncharacterized protein n=1 Tax=Echinococcus multilocularis TaxID=6211 RepID=A0A068Y3G3_ECHMU|nr:hypothetical protein EmuJ_000494100 [Echinococcus multilocularis]